MTRLLRTLGYEPVVANPRKLKAISANTRKSDRNDALLLAKLVWSDPSLLHPIHHRSEARALGLSLLSARDALVRARTRLVSAVRSMCKGVGTRLKSGSADAFVNCEPDVPAALAPITAGMFVALRSFNEQIAAYDGQLETMIETTFAEAQRVKQVRGVGPVTALSFLLTLEDPSRFRDGRNAAAFLGLVPRRDQSGVIDKQLGISKTGSTLMRRLLVQCAHHILGPLGHDCDIQRWGRKLMERGGKSARKRAIVAAARKLAVLLPSLPSRLTAQRARMTRLTVNVAGEIAAPTMTRTPAYTEPSMAPRRVRIEAWALGRSPRARVAAVVAVLGGDLDHAGDVSRVDVAAHQALEVPVRRR